MNLSPALRLWLRYALLGLLPVWILDAILLPRLIPLTPVLLLVSVAAVSVLEGAVFGTQFGLLAGFLWATAYAPTDPGRILLLALIGMISGIVSQYALRRSLLGCMVCTAGALAIYGCLNVLSGLINSLAVPSALLGMAVTEAILSLLFTPVVYWLFSRLGRKPGRPRS